MSDLTDIKLIIFRRTNMVLYTLEQLFAKWACDQLAEDAEKIIVLDEAHCVYSMSEYLKYCS